MATSRRRCFICGLLLLFGWRASTAVAGPAIVTGISEDVYLLPTPPLSVAPGGLESTAMIFGFFEQQGVVISSPLSLDITNAGETFGTGQPYDFNNLPSTGPIPTGTEVDAYMIHAGTAFVPNVNLSGSITFNKEILGLDVLVPSLNSTNAEFGATGTIYPTVANWGLEDDGDTIIISSDRHTVSFVFDYGQPGDSFRIFLAQQSDPPSGVPEPASLVLAITAGACYLGWRCWSREGKRGQERRRS